MSDAGKIAAETPPDRDRAVDVARLAALVVVMFGHCALLLATIDTGGLRIGNLLGELPAIAPITWVVQVMPLFFLAGGAAGAYGWHAGTSWGTWLFTRAQRLCRPVFWYLAAWTVGLFVVRVTLGADSAAGLGRECVALLWFLGVYLVVLAFVPALTRLSTGRAVTVVVVSLLAAAAAVDAIRTRRRHTHVGCRQLPHRLADPRRDRRGLRAPTDRDAGSAGRGRRRIHRPDNALPGGSIRGFPGGDGHRAAVQCVAADARARAALHLDVMRVRGGRGRNPAMGCAAPRLVRRRGRQRGSDDALPMAHPRDRGGRLLPATPLASTPTTCTRRASGACSRCGRSCSPSSWPRRSDFSHRSSIAGCRGGMRRLGPPVPGQPLPVC